LAIDLSLNSSTEFTVHVVEVELGRESHCGIVLRRAILEGQGLNTDEVFAAGGTNAAVRGELNGADFGHVGVVTDELQAGLLLGISSVDTDFAWTIFVKTRLAAAILPLNLSLLTTSKMCGRDRVGNERNCKSNGNRSENNKRFGEHFLGLKITRVRLREREGLLRSRN